MPTCRYCPSTETLTIPGPFPGGHHAKLVCASCGLMIQWLKAPAVDSGEIPTALLPFLEPRREPAALDGTPKQVEWAASIRAGLMRVAREAGDDRLTLLLPAVRDATWFIAQKGLAAGGIRWPRVDQMAPCEAVPAIRRAGASRP